MVKEFFAAVVLKNVSVKSGSTSHPADDPERASRRKNKKIIKIDINDGRNPIKEPKEKKTAD